MRQEDLERYIGREATALQTIIHCRFFVFEFMPSFDLTLLSVGNYKPSNII